jgi:alpha-L-arabinofuranosidase
VQKLFSVNQGDLFFSKVIAEETADSALASSCVQDSQTGDIILKMVNAGNDAGIFQVNLTGFKIFPDSEMTLLTGDPDAENTFKNPENVVPLVAGFSASQRFNYSAPPMSVTVIRIKKKK